MPDTNIDVRKLILATAEYEKEIERVRAIDPEAADYMDGPARELPDFMSWELPGPTNPAQRGWLSWAFYWGDTPQGKEYWDLLCTKLHPGCE